MYYFNISFVESVSNPPILVEDSSGEILGGLSHDTEDSYLGVVTLSDEVKLACEVEGGLWATPQYQIQDGRIFINKVFLTDHKVMFSSQKVRLFASET